MKGKEKYLGILVLPALLCLVAVGCWQKARTLPPQEQGERIILRYAEVNPKDHIITQTGQYFADQVQHLSGGRIEIQIYDSGQLGDDSQYYQQMQMGALDMYRGNTIALTDLPQVQAGILAMPYLFRDDDHFWKVCESSLGKEILEDIQTSGSGMVGLCYLDEGVRNIMTTGQPVTSLADLKEKQIRSMHSAILEDTLRALGAEPVAMGYPDLYSALQSGTVDGAENPVSSYYYNQFYQEAPFYTRSGHTHAPSILLVSEITWKHLTDADKEILRQAAAKAQEYNRSSLEQAEKAVYQKLEALGITVTELTDPEDWRKAAAEIYETYESRFPGLIERLKGL